MYEYSMAQWFFLFYFYCFIGWCIESTYVSLKSKKFVNRGFMRGPFLPIYGSGAIMMLVVSRPFSNSLILTFIAGCLGATALEYVTGVLMEALFKVRYWDYSNQPFNYKGYICLGSTLAWGGLTILMTRVIHTPIESMLLSLPVVVVNIVVLILTNVIAVDVAFAFREAMDLRDVLIAMEKAKEELARMQKRLDVMIAVMDDAADDWKEELGQKIETKVERIMEKSEMKKQAKEYRTEELLDSVEGRITRLKQLVKEKSYEAFGEEMSELIAKFTIHKDKKLSLKERLGKYKKGMILSNPTAISNKFKKAFEEIKETIEEWARD